MANGLFNLKQVMQAVQQGGWPAQKTPAVEYLVVGGGGSGGGGSFYGSGGGAAGGLLQGIDPVPNGQTLLVTVGAGGATAPGNAATNPGFNSVFGSITALGGASTSGGGSGNGGDGGSGSGGGSGVQYVSQGGLGTFNQGNNGGTGLYGGGGYGGGGGAGAAGSNGYSTGGGNGGNGIASAISGTVTAYAGGGGGGVTAGVDGGTLGQGGVGGGGLGGRQSGSASNVNGSPGADNTGGGGGSSGGFNTNSGGAGGSGIVIISYPDVYAAAASTTGTVTISTSGSGSLYPNGAGTLQSSTTAPSQAGDFTLECWLNTSATGSYRLFAGTGTGANYVGLFSGNFVVNSSTTGTEKQIAISGGAPAINTWFHYCLMRSGTTLYGFINGVFQGVVTFTDTLFAAGNLQVCGYTSSYQFPGYVSNLRLTNTLVYPTAGFTVPTGPLANVTGTALLMNTASGAPYLDTSSNAATFSTFSGTQPLWNQESPFATGAGYKNRVYKWTTSGSITF